MPKKRRLPASSFNTTILALGVLTILVAVFLLCCRHTFKRALRGVPRPTPITDHLMLIESLFPENVEFVAEPLVIEAGTAPSGWLPYEVETFTVFYPPNRKVYGAEEQVFSLCPEAHCQDLEMTIYQESDPNFFMAAEYRKLIDLRARSTGEAKNSTFRIYKDVNISGLPGIGMTENANGVLQTRNNYVDAAINANGKIMKIYFDKSNPVHTNILKTLVVK